MQLILPQELHDVVWKDVEAKISDIQYSRVIMSLSELLEGEFFNHYIKIGISTLVHVLRDLWHIILCIKHVFTPLISSSHLFSGNILMLSEGRPGVDDRYSLKDGNDVIESGRSRGFE